MKFKFYINNDLHFVGQLDFERCAGTSKNGNRCKRRVCIGLPYCFQHIKIEKHLQIKTSTIPNSGKGLFAFSKIPNELLFRKDQTIIQYYGELISEDEKEERYDDKTAPYGVIISQNEFEDAALRRGIGAIINHNTSRYVNARLGVCFNKNPHYVVIKANKNIYNGQEIFINYGDRYAMHEEGVYYTTK